MKISKYGNGTYLRKWFWRADEIIHIKFSVQDQTYNKCSINKGYFIYLPYDIASKVLFMFFFPTFSVGVYTHHQWYCIGYTWTVIF